MLALILGAEFNDLVETQFLDISVRFFSHAVSCGLVG